MRFIRGEILKISLNAWSIMPPNATLDMYDVFLKIAKNSSYEGFEFCYDDSNFDPSRITKDLRKKLVEKARSYDIVFSSVATGVFWKYNLGLSLIHI